MVTVYLKNGTVCEGNGGTNVAEFKLDDVSGYTVTDGAKSD
jgi:hypothetical protein